jgi:hypothetical protein
MLPYEHLEEFDDEERTDRRDSGQINVNAKWLRLKLQSLSYLRLYMSTCVGIVGAHTPKPFLE